MPEHSAAELPKKRALVHGKSMAYYEAGEGDPIVFLHGNPTSSYLWRNIIPHVADMGRVIAPDLIGMGDSDKLDHTGRGSYTFVEHRRFLDELLAQLGVTENVTLVIHDWGSALGFDWANRHRGAVKAICYMEAVVRPLEWQEFPEASHSVFKGFRSDKGESLVLDKNVFVERVLPGSILRKLSDEEMAAYRKPFAEAGEGRRPTLTWPRQIPISGEPPEVVRIAGAYADYMACNQIPKLFVNADPGAILIGPQREFCRAWPNQTEITVPGIHFIQEDSAKEIGEALRTWLISL